MRRELGTLGHGNHFAELQELAGIRLPDRARELGLDRRNLWLLVHSGSRGHGPALLERTPKGGLDPGSEAGKRYLERHNRLLAWAKRSRRLAAAGFLSLAGLEAEAWRGHRELERGNPAFVIRGRELWDLERFGEAVFFR
ncbi:RtcB family protein [bacterium]|nr:RtcB family protein [bacterium]